MARTCPSRWSRSTPGATRARPPPKLAPDQKRLLPAFLGHGAEVYGFRGEVWTCARVARILKEEFGVRSHQGHVSRVLQELRGTPPVPLRRALPRDEEALQRWRVEVWPAWQPRARRARRTLVCVEEAGFSLRPGVVRTYAPEARTPLLGEKQTRAPRSVLGGLTPRSKSYTLVRQESLTGLHRVAFLRPLRRVAGPRLLVLWEGSPLPRRAEVKEFVSGTQGRSGREALPGYAPELNPWDEGGGHHRKHVERRNLVCLDLEELPEEFHRAVSRLRQKPHLIQSFFAQAGLTIEKG